MCVYVLRTPKLLRTGERYQWKAYDIPKTFGFPVPVPRSSPSGQNRSFSNLEKMGRSKGISVVTTKDFREGRGCKYYGAVKETSPCLKPSPVSMLISLIQHEHLHLKLCDLVLDAREQNLGEL